MRDSRISRSIEDALFEDIGLGDLTTDCIVPPNLRGTAALLVKETGVIAGLDVAVAVFHHVDPEIRFEPHVHDGDRVVSGTNVAHLDGPLASILKAERTALNFLQRMSGIATLTRSFVDAVKHTNARITDTRKTAPGLRALDKLAVLHGGGANHRFGLDDMVLIKDNHSDSAGGIGLAIERCLASLRARGVDVKIEVETRSLEEVHEALRHSGIHRIMLDHFDIPHMRQAVEYIAGRADVEASGNVTLSTVREIAETGVDFISVGALTHSPKALDISLDIIPLPRT